MTHLSMFQDGLVHVQSLDHALPVVHRILEADADQGIVTRFIIFITFFRSFTSQYELKHDGVTGLTHLHLEEEEQTIQHRQGEDKRNVHDHH